MVNNRNDLRLELEQMTTDKLAAMLQAETGKEIPDDDRVLLILDILEARVAEKPVELNPREKAIWKQYLAKAKKRARPKISWSRAAVAVAATLAVVIGMLFVAMPQEARAGSIYDVIAYCTDSILEFLGSSSDESMLPKFEFVTEHPGLQKLHDTLLEYGIDGPAVPMWIPEEYDELSTLDIDRTPYYTSISALFTDGSKELVIRFDIYEDVAPRRYDKDLQEPEKLELFGTIHQYVKNIDKYTAIWNRDNLEGSITVDCQVDTLISILKSIYVKGVI